MISVRFQRKPFNITAIQVYIPTNNAEETEVEQFFEDLQNLLELTPKKDVLFIGDWNAKVVSQEIPGVTGNFGLRVQNEAGKRLTRVLPRGHTGHSKHPLPTTREDYTWTSSDGQHRNQTDYIPCSQRWRSSI